MSMVPATMATMVTEVIERILLATPGPELKVQSLIDRRSPARIPPARIMAGRLKNIVGSNGKGSAIRKFLVHIQVQQPIGIGNETLGFRKC